MKDNYYFKHAGTFIQKTYFNATVDNHQYNSMNIGYYGQLRENGKYLQIFLFLVLKTWVGMTKS